MNSQEWIWSLDVEVPAVADECPIVVAKVLAALEKHQWSEEDRFAVRMVLEEGIMNAIKHGNHCDPDKPVHVVVNLSNDVVSASIEDLGCGFNPDDVPDPTLDENIGKTCGRGVMLMKNFVDSIRYNDTGNRVEWVKKKSG